MGLSGKPIFIVGSGAIGKALAVFLAEAGRKVTMIRGSVDDDRRTSGRFVVEMEHSTILDAVVKIEPLNGRSTLDGIIVLATKSFGNKELAAALKARAGDSAVVLLQNGLGIEQPFLEQGFRHVYRCVLFVTSQSIDETRVRFKPVDHSPIGIVQGNRDQLGDIVAHLHTPGFRFLAENNIEQVAWKKTIINCVFNSVCSLLEIDNGIFHRNPYALNIARRIITECIAIARAKGISLVPEEVEAALLQISRMSDGQEISTLQDIRRRRRTEMESLNAEIVKLAEQMHLEEFVRETRLLGELTKLKSECSMY